MAEQIKIDAKELAQISSQFKKIEKNAQETERLINSARNSLDWKVSSKEEIDGILGTVSQAINISREKLNFMSEASEMAVIKSEDFNSEVTKWVSGIITVIVGMFGVFSPIGKLSVINMLTGMKDTLTHTVLKTNRSSGGGGYTAYGAGAGGGGSRGVDKPEEKQASESKNEDIPAISYEPRFVNAWTGAKDFDKSIWGENYNLSSGCGVASMSMLMSTIGINVTPKEIMEYNLSDRNGYVQTYMDEAYNISHYPDVKGVSTWSDQAGLDTALNNYLEHPGKYSAPMIWMEFEEQSHAVLVTGKNSDGTYSILDPSGYGIKTYSFSDIKASWGSNTKDKLFHSKLASVRQYYK